MLLRSIITGLPVLAALLALIDLPHWHAARTGLPPQPTDPTNQRPCEALIVLGYRSARNGRTHPIQRWRCRIAVRSRDPGRSSTVIFTGGEFQPGITEAGAMAAYARQHLALEENAIRLETEALDTIQNLTYSLRLTGAQDAIKIVSDPIHAARARQHLALHQPDVWLRVEPAEDYRRFEELGLKAATVAYATYRRVRDLVASKVST